MILNTKVVSLRVDRRLPFIRWLKIRMTPLGGVSLVTKILFGKEYHDLSSACVNASAATLAIVAKSPAAFLSCL